MVSQIFSCGMNDQHQLGYNQDKQMKFKEVPFISNNAPMLVKYEFLLFLMDVKF